MLYISTVWRISFGTRDWHKASRQALYHVTIFPGFHRYFFWEIKLCKKKRGKTYSTIPAYWTDSVSRESLTHPIPENIWGNVEWMHTIFKLPDNKNGDYVMKKASYAWKPVLIKLCSWIKGQCKHIGVISYELDLQCPRG